MSYDIRLTDPVTGDTLYSREPHLMAGSVYAVGGTRELWLNVTYNYAPIFVRVLGEEGIRTIYGLSGAESLPLLEGAIAKLSKDATDNYYEATEGNARRALRQLVALANMRPDGVWDGD